MSIVAWMSSGRKAKRSHTAQCVRCNNAPVVTFVRGEKGRGAAIVVFPRHAHIWWVHTPGGGRAPNSSSSSSQKQQQPTFVHRGVFWDVLVRWMSDSNCFYFIFLPLFNNKLIQWHCVPLLPRLWAQPSAAHCYSALMYFFYILLPPPRSSLSSLYGMDAATLSSPSSRLIFIININIWRFFFWVVLCWWISFGHWSLSGGAVLCATEWPPSPCWIWRRQVSLPEFWSLFFTFIPDIMPLSMLHYTLFSLSLLLLQPFSSLPDFYNIQSDYSHT